MIDKELEKFRQWQNSPIMFIKDNWGLEPQRVGSEYKNRFQKLAYSKNTEWAKEITEEWFEGFEKGKNISWHQYLFLLSIERAIEGISKKRITIQSGHGTGKSSCLSWLIIWYLFCHKDAQVPCTAPTTNQMHDVLWKELSKWLDKMNPEIAEKFEKSSEYLRVMERPETWFARAKTARKEAPEALAGIHGEYVMFVVDEASAVPDEIFNTAEGALTEEGVLIIMISNHTRVNGYFHNSHTNPKEMENWQRLTFNSEQSPLVKDDYIERIIELHGKDSDEYRIRVLGVSPIIDGIDEKGFIPLLKEQEIVLEAESEFVGDVRLGIDPSGEGTDLTAWVLRDNRKARVGCKEAISNPKTIAEKTLTLMTEHDIYVDDVMVDSFGVGSDVGKEIALSNKDDVGTVNVGDNKYDDIDIDKIYQNLKAQSYFRVKEWFKRGGIIIDNQDGLKLKEELLTIKYKRNLRGKIQIMSKLDMKKEGIPSPNFADALMLTFVCDEGGALKEIGGGLYNQNYR